MRGAWIEMSRTRCGRRRWRVAPRAGSVDLNRALYVRAFDRMVGRSPCGERGLKFCGGRE